MSMQKNKIKEIYAIKKIYFYRFTYFIMFKLRSNLVHKNGKTKKLSCLTDCWHKKEIEKQFKY